MNFNNFANAGVKASASENVLGRNLSLEIECSIPASFKETELVSTKDEVDIKQTLWPTFYRMNEVFYFSTTLHRMCTE